jgi:hypothetical protein
MISRRILSLPLAAFIPLLLAACVMRQAPDQYGRWDSCDAFAWSGGYPIAWGADLGGNPNFLYLPNQAPVRISNDFLQRHLEITDALRDWCQRNMTPAP